MVYYLVLKGWFWELQFKIKSKYKDKMFHFQTDKQEANQGWLLQLDFLMFNVKLQSKTISNKIS